MKMNVFRTTTPTSRYMPAPRKIHAVFRNPTPERTPNQSFRILRRLVRWRDSLAVSLAIAGFMYLACRFALGFVVSRRLSEMLTLGGLAAMLMLASALCLSIKSSKDDKRVRP